AQQIFFQHRISDAVACDGQMQVEAFHPAPGTTIYVRRLQVYLWGQQTDNARYCGFASVQFNDPRDNWIRAGWATMAKFSPGFPQYSQTSAAAGTYMLLVPGDTLFVEKTCLPGCNPFQPVVDVDWTTAP